MAKSATRFRLSSRPHVLMITNHGIHQWEVKPGLPDTGGQNVFVNRLTAELAQQGFKITIVNRGGYAHPLTHELRRGFHYRDDFQRLLYLQDGLAAFVRKEEMAERLPHLTTELDETLGLEKTPVDLILSHYWDGAALGVRYNRRRSTPALHAWIPHSLGAVKKRNVAPERWSELRIDARIAMERELVAAVDGVVATSSTIRQSLCEDYGYDGPDLFLPPCVDTDRYHPREIDAGDPIWAFLGERAGLPAEEVRRRKIVTEISRTDTTKRKDVLIEAFARAHAEVPESLLVVAIDPRQPLAEELRALIRARGLEHDVAVVGSIPQRLPKVYAVTDIYCTPSVMEGFGMSAQEAAATGVPVIASHRVPFATEYLLGEEVESVEVPDSDHPLRRGEGAIVVQADDVAGFAAALTRLLTDQALSRRMGRRALEITVPYFTWSKQVPAFLEAMKM